MMPPLAIKLLFFLINNIYYENYIWRGTQKTFAHLNGMKENDTETTDDAKNIDKLYLKATRLDEI